MCLSENYLRLKCLILIFFNLIKMPSYSTMISENELKIRFQKEMSRLLFVSNQSHKMKMISKSLKGKNLFSIRKIQQALKNPNFQLSYAQTRRRNQYQLKILHFLKNHKMTVDLKFLRSLKDDHDPNLFSNINKTDTSKAILIHSHNCLQGSHKVQLLQYS